VSGLVTTHLRFKRSRAINGEMITTVYGKDIVPGGEVHWEHFLHRCYGPDSLEKAREFAVSVGLPVVKTWAEAMEQAGVDKRDGHYYQEGQ